VRTTGGVFRLKQHLAGGHRNTLGCQKVPEHVRNEIQNYMEQKKITKETYNMSKHINQHYMGEGEEYDDDGDDCVGKVGVENFQAAAPREVVACLPRNQDKKAL